MKVKIINSLLIPFFLIFLVFFFFLFFYLKRNKRSSKKTLISSPKNFVKDKESNPDINTDNWDLHKLRLEKFKRSQYKGLTFFLSSENRIYYISEKGVKIYC